MATVSDLGTDWWLARVSINGNAPERSEITFIELADENGGSPVQITISGLDAILALADAIRLEQELAEERRGLECEPKGD